MRVYGSWGRTMSQERQCCVRGIVQSLDGRVLRWEDNIPDECDVFISWGMRFNKNFHAFVKRGGVSICLDRGYFDATRFHRFSVSVQGTHGLSMPLPEVLDLPPREHPILQPWKDETEGEFIQIVTPGAGQGYWRTPDVKRRLPEGWVSKTATEASAVFGLPAKIRYHPRALPLNTPTPPPLADTFEETFVSVSYLSLSGVQTVIAGVPTVVLHPRSVAFPMGASGYKRVTPCREAWIHDLSHRDYEMNNEREHSAACDYITRASTAAQKAGPLKSPLSRYGIKGEWDD